MYIKDGLGGYGIDELFDLFDRFDRVLRQSSDRPRIIAALPMDRERERVLIGLGSQVLISVTSVSADAFAIATAGNLLEAIGLDPDQVTVATRDALPSEPTRIELCVATWQRPRATVSDLHWVAITEAIAGWPEGKIVALLRATLEWHRSEGSR